MIEQAVEALRDGRTVVLPTDTVYGLCGDPHSETAAGEIYRLKQRPAEQPLALLAKDVGTLVELVPELPRATLALLPGPYTLVLPN
ncbi:MAG TPA: Sua5/YciO/YrdC/YwlC family protein, partial [Gaiellaceae bacterium]|nr:Sua5/YciO/YrdC/YwlC family protein [Gaiellaceae bacterium]